MGGRPRISFGIIVLNGEPFTRYCLRSIYPYAHEIIVVEGGHEDTHSVTTPDGHSIDGTLDVLHRFCSDEDPEGKVRIVTRDGFWPKKDELGHDRTPQSRAYAELATGDYLWQVDVDEFYRDADMHAVVKMLGSDLSITAVSFRNLTFWGDTRYVADGWAARRDGHVYHRLFKWGPGYRYVTHEPPTVHNSSGQDLRDLNWISDQATAARGIYLYHYSLLFPWQVRQKTLIYRDEKPQECSEILEWAEENYFKLGNPFRVHNRYQAPGWLERYRGDHPPEVLRMMDDVRSGRVVAETRRTDDVERLLNSIWYPPCRMLVKMLDYPDRAASRIRRAFGGARQNRQYSLPSFMTASRAVSNHAPVHLVVLSPNDGFPHGMAATNRIRLLSRALVEQAVDVTVLCTRVSEKPPAISNWATAGVFEGVRFEYTTGTTVRSDSFAERRRIEAKGYAVALWRLLSLERKRRLDAVYLWPESARWEPSSWVLVRVLNVLHAPVILELNERPWSLRPDANPLDRLISPLSGVSGVVAISTSLAEWARIESTRIGRRVHIAQIPIVADTAEATVSDYPEGDPSVLIAIAPSYSTTIDFTLQAMRAVWQVFPRCRLVVTGIDGSAVTECRQLSSLATAAHDSRVVVPGYVKRGDLLSLYAGSRALLAPLFDDVTSQSRFPSKIAEYLSSGRPVVTTSVGEVARYLRDGVNAYVARPGSPDRFASKIIEVLGDPKRADRVGRAGRNVAKSSFDYARYAPALRELVELIAGETPTAKRRR